MSMLKVIADRASAAALDGTPRVLRRAVGDIAAMAKAGWEAEQKAIDPFDAATQEAMRTIVALLGARTTRVESEYRDYDRGLVTEAELLDTLVGYGMATRLPPSHPVMKRVHCYHCDRPIVPLEAHRVKRWLEDNPRMADEVTQTYVRVMGAERDVWVNDDPTWPAYKSYAALCAACATPFGYRRSR